MAWQKLGWEGRASGLSRHKVGTKVIGGWALRFHPLFSVLNYECLRVGLLKLMVQDSGPCLSVCPSVPDWLSLCGLPKLISIYQPSLLVPFASVIALFTVSFSLYLSRLSFPLFVSLQSVPPSMGTRH